MGHKHTETQPIRIFLSCSPACLFFSPIALNSHTVYSQLSLQFQLPFSIDCSRSLQAKANTHEDRRGGQSQQRW